MSEELDIETSVRQILLSMERQHHGAGRPTSGWRNAFRLLKWEYKRQALLLLELADAEAITAERDHIYAFVKRSAFAHEFLAEHEAGKRSDDPEYNPFGAPLQRKAGRDE